MIQPSQRSFAVWAWRCTLLLLFTGAIVVAAKRTPAPALAAIEPTLSWSRQEIFDGGENSFVALNASGFIVEVHRSAASISTGLYYRLGKLNMQKGTLEWGPSRRFSNSGNWPAVAVSNGGLVLITRSDAPYNCCSSLEYYVGTVNVSGDINQEIQFRESGVVHDRGFHNGISLNRSGVIADVHESGNGGSGIYYRIGHFVGYNIVWDSGTNGIKYDDGVDPRISIDDRGNVVEVHGVKNESFLHYIRGRISNSSIAFGSDRPRLDRNGKRPSVALLDSSFLIQTNSTGLAPFYRIGALSPTNGGGINFSASAPINGLYDVGENVSVAANDFWALVTFQSGGKLYYSTAKLY